MILLICSVYDRKAAVYARPFVTPNRAMARRSFESARQDPTTELHKFPEDFSLYVLGTFNDETGEVVSQVPTVIALNEE